MINPLSFTNGRFFSVTFEKKNGETRKMIARLGVKKFLSGGERKNSNPNHVIVWEVGNGYRTVNMETLKEVKCGGVHLKGL